MPAANARPPEPPSDEVPEPGRAPTEYEGNTMDKRTTEREAVAELRDGMTIGIGGWGSRRKQAHRQEQVRHAHARRLASNSHAMMPNEKTSTLCEYISPAHTSGAM